MADKNQINIRIGLEGDAEIKRKLDQVRDISKKAGDEVSKSLNRTGEGFGGLGKTEESRIAAEKLREVLHTLHPVLDSAGLGLGNLGAFARVAGAGLGAFTAAVVGSAIVGLARLADQSAATRKQLDDLSQGQGGAHFAGLKEDAKRLGTDVDNLVPAYKQVLGLRNDLNTSNRSLTYAPGHEPFSLPGGPLSNENIRAATGSVQSLFAAGKADDPAKAAADFFNALRKSGGRLTPEALQGAAGASEGAANKIAQSLPEGFASYQQAIAALNSGRVIDRDELFRSLAKAAPEAEKAAKSVRGLKEALDGAVGSAKELGKSIAGENLGKNLAGGIDKATGGIDKATELVEHSKDKIQQGAKTGYEIGNKVPIPGAGLIGGAIGGGGAAGVGIGGDLLREAKEPLSKLFEGGVPEFLKNAITDPGALQERQRPETGPSSLGPVPNLGPRSEAEGVAAPQQFAGLSETLQQLFQSVLGAVTRQPELKQQGPTTGLGIRGEVPDDASRGIADLGQQAERVAQVLAFAADVRRRSEEGVAHAAGGGHIRGAGTATSDSIPAMLSDGEYVMKAEAVKRIGVDRLDAANNGVAHFAEGGNVTSANLPPGQHDITADGAGGAIIDGVNYPKGSAILQNPLVQAGIAASLKKQPQQKNRRYHSPFIATDEDKQANQDASDAYEASLADTTSYVDGPPISHFAEGGRVGGASSRLASIISSIGNNGVIDFDVQHLAAGGPDWSAPTLSASEMNDSGASGIGPLHPVTLNLPGGDSIDGFHAQPDAVAQLRTAAMKAKRFSTGAKPSWYGK